MAALGGHTLKGAFDGIERHGFGSMVAETMAERSLDGKVDIDYALSGLTWRLTCRAANAQELPRA